MSAFPGIQFLVFLATSVAIFLSFLPRLTHQQNFELRIKYRRGFVNETALAAVNASHHGEHNLPGCAVACSHLNYLNEPCNVYFVVVNATDGLNDTELVTGQCFTSGDDVQTIRGMLIQEEGFDATKALEVRVRVG